ncbi:MAG: tetratricopeptide repeat protein [Anaerolineae bacterium]
MADAFISYSRRDGEFVHKLEDALAAAQKNVWVDWEDIARGLNWWKEIQTGIESADTTLIVVTEHWLLSEICHRELEYVRANNKRVFPVIRQQIAGDVEIRVKGTWVDQEWEQRARDNWKYLRSLNWLFFDDDAKFENAFADLLIALDSDQSHIKAHTRYQMRGLEWTQSQRNPSFLLEGDDLAYAERWLADSADKKPEPTEVHHDYIMTSRQAANSKMAREAARERLVQQSRRAAVVLGTVGTIAILAVLASIPISINAVNSNATSVAQVATATVEQGLAVMAQQTSEAREQASSTQVAVAGATLSPVPPTLTAVADAIEQAKIEQNIALDLADASLDISNGDSENALISAQGLVEDYPNQPLAWMSNALILSSAGQNEEAIASYTHVIELDPTNELAYYNRGTSYWELEERDKALADYSKAIELAPDYALIYFNRGELYAEMDRLEEAIGDLTQSIELDPDHIEAYQERGISYYQLSNFSAALADWATFEEMGGELSKDNRALRDNLLVTVTATPAS